MPANGRSRSVAIEVLAEPRRAAAPGRCCASWSTMTAAGCRPSERAHMARRGHRLDETKPGSGLGLSIVVDLAALYGGGLTLGTAPIGGLRAELVLPGA